MSKIATIALVVVASAFIAQPVLAGVLDEWCQTEAKRPSSIVICSDYTLRQLAVERNRALAEARNELGKR
jgi:hypothetical protein